MDNRPKYPIYIVSKGRAATPLTANALRDMHQPFYLICERNEYEQYLPIAGDRTLILPEYFLADYDTCDDFGDNKSRGPGAARNFAWEHSIGLGAGRHWVLDDNIDGFMRLNRNLKLHVRTPATFRAIEDWCDRYENVAIAGMNYAMFAKRKDSAPAFVLNTRIYSCLLIANDIPYRWRGRYNEDTDLSLRVLKDGLCTVQFNAFLANKVRTQTLAGGNTEAFYEHEGTMPKSQMLADLHPDVAVVEWKFGRWHHFVNYNPFKSNRLRLKEGIEVPDSPNEYGMILREASVGA